MKGLQSYLRSEHSRRDTPSLGDAGRRGERPLCGRLQAFMCSTGFYDRVFKPHIVEHPLDRGALRICAA